MTKHMKKLFSTTVIGLSGLALGWTQVLAAHTHDEHDHQHHATTDEHDFDDEFSLAQPSQEIAIEQCWVRWLPGDVPAAGYFELQNTKGTPMEWLAVRSSDKTLLMRHHSQEMDGYEKMKMGHAIINARQDTKS